MSLYFDLVSIPHGKNLDRIGWCKGYLMVIFKGRPDRYIYGPNIDAAEKDKLVRSPYPDGLFTKLKAKHGWQCHKVGSKDAA